MARSAEDRALLRGIEAGLMQDDPRLVERFRSWEPTSARRSLPPGWCGVPLWALLVFLVAFVGWIVSPALGVLGVATGVIVWLWARWDQRRGA